VSVDGDSVIGFAWAITTRALDRSAYLRLLLVSEEHQSRGVGAALLARVEREARSAQCRHLVLLVTRTNKRARSFYERHGYARVLRAVRMEAAARAEQGAQQALVQSDEG